jgi:hypothetical protein
MASSITLMHVNDVDLHRIASSIASDGHTGVNQKVYQSITPEMLKEMGVDENAQPYEEGMSSAVFDNTRGNIVVFSLRNINYIANNISGPLSDVLPTIVKTEKFPLEETTETDWREPSDFLYAVEMERLDPLSSEEELVFTIWKGPIFEGNPDTPEDEARFILETPDDISVPRETIDKMIPAMRFLKKKSERLNVYHFDLHARNVMWGKDGNLKFIDLEDVGLLEAELAPQSTREASRHAIDEHTGYNPTVLKLITDEMRSEMDVSLDAHPYEEGSRSVVFDNERGNIIVFSIHDNAKRIAEQIKGPYSEILPEVFKIEKFDISSSDYSWWSNSNNIYAIEMERLTPLSEDEMEVYESWTRRVFGKNKMSNPDLYLQWMDTERRMPIEERIVPAMEDLAHNAENLGVSQSDLHGGNVAWDKEGGLKFLDLDSIDLKDVDLSPQSERTAMNLIKIATKIAATTYKSWPEYASIEDFVQFLIDDERDQFTHEDLQALNYRLRRPVKDIKEELQGWGFTLQLREPEKKVRGIQTPSHDRWFGPGSMPTHGGSGFGPEFD